MDSRKFVKLLRGDWKNMYPSQSEADLALLRYLYRWGATETGARDIFLASGMRREKTLSRRRNSTYLDKSIEKIYEEDRQA